MASGMRPKKKRNLEDKAMATKKAPKSRKKGLKKVALKPIKTLKPLSYGSIQGDSTQAGHEKWIEINSF